MSVKDAFSKAEPFIVGIGIPVGLAILAISVPIIYDLKGAVSKLEGAQPLFQAALSD